MKVISPEREIIKFQKEKNCWPRADRKKHASMNGKRKNQIL
jgi:hypothetical protein